LLAFKTNEKNNRERRQVGSICS